LSRRYRLPFRDASYRGDGSCRPGRRSAGRLGREPSRPAVAERHDRHRPSPPDPSGRVGGSWWTVSRGRRAVEPPDGRGVERRDRRPVTADSKPRTPTSQRQFTLRGCQHLFASVAADRPVRCRPVNQGGQPDVVVADAAVDGGDLDLLGAGLGDEHPSNGSAWWEGSRAAATAGPAVMASGSKAPWA